MRPPRLGNKGKGMRARVRGSPRPVSSRLENRWPATRGRKTGVELRGILPLVWATLERGVPRLASAIVMLLFARHAGPEAVGIYGWVVLAYTFYQAVAENGLRQLAVNCVSNPGDVAFVRRTSVRAALIGGLVLLCVVCGLSYQHRADLLTVALGLLPISFAPFITSAGIGAVGRLEFVRAWPALARYQMLSSLAGLSVSLAIITATRSSLAMAAHVVATETTFTFLCLRHSRRLNIDHNLPSSKPATQIRHLSTLSVLGWSQGQLERVFVGAMADKGGLGLYTTAVTVGRSPGDALAMATSNYLRASVVALRADGGSADSDTARIVQRIGLMAVGSASTFALAVVFLAEPVFGWILGPTWISVLHAAPLMAVATIPSVVSSGQLIMAVFSGHGRRSAIPVLIGVSFALPIGFAASTSIQLAAGVVLVKELVMLVVTEILCGIPGSRWPVRAALVCALACAALAGGVDALR